jgi:hypothetical protein
VEKRSASPGKASSGGTKTAWRTTGADGSIVSEVLTVDASPPAGAYPVAVPLLDGAIRAESTTFGAQSTAAARDRCSTAVATVRVPVRTEVRSGAGSAPQEETP